ncbi:MAG TPA: uracil-DNA glycosylase family protein [Gammaproteobacteria bacterium]|nr:uracil-DNA glycosylase family protein [Gammaproteobacteria bacterium]
MRDAGDRFRRLLSSVITTRSTVIQVARRLARDTAALEWNTPSHVYNPLKYAWNGHREYLERYGARHNRILLLGMNPGPWGMAQTGIPFGNIVAVREWFRIETRLSRTLPPQHPKYPIRGMACHRNEGSGSRLWGWARERIGEPQQFFNRFFVWNYCPLLFLGKNRNLPPIGLSPNERHALQEVCDEALAGVVEILDPRAVVGIGRYAERRARELLGDRLPVGYLPHPSPASPAANRDWPGLAEHALAPWLPDRPRSQTAN